MIGYGFDPTYIFVIIGLLVSMWASFNVKSTFSRYSTMRNSRGLTGAQAAELILRQAGINDVSIAHVSGNLTDHYSPTEKVLRLSDSVYSSTSVAAVGVAAHECGHAIQHQVGYAALGLRSAAVPVCNIGSFAYWPVFLIGLFINQPFIAYIGIYLFLFVIAFQLITLPVEFNASSRALKILDQSGILGMQEHKAATKVLKAAALTYVAALFASIMTLLRMLTIINGGRRRR